MAEDQTQQRKKKLLADFRRAIGRLRRKLRWWFLYTIKPLGNGMGYVIEKLFGDDSLLFLALLTKEDKLTYETNREEIREKAEEELGKFSQEDGIEVWRSKRCKENYFDSKDHERSGEYYE